MNRQWNLDAYQYLDGRTLKLLAMGTMLIDHIGAALLPELIILRLIGRLAFPIYCFLLVEGAHYTHDMKKYMLRMGIFALISEIPFDMAFYGGLYFGHQNVFFTLLIGLAMIWFLEHPMNDMEIPDVINKIMIVAVAGIAAELLKTDYGFMGIGVIFVFYFLRERPLLKYILVAVLCIGSSWIEAFAAIALVPIALYNGRRGRQTKLMQYGFYAFYPLHLAILAVIRQIILMVAG